MADEPNSEPDLPAGTRLGRYRLERQIGAGGMGAVYLASHTGLNKPVVVKVLHPQYARSAEVRLRFVREGEAAARIRHAHVVDVTDVGVEGATPYLVMEFLEGESLGALIDRQGALAPDRAVDLLLPVLDAVNAAHAVGVVHRDLKPDNLFIVRTPTGDPHPKVLDFGISRVVDESARPDRTGTAAMLGTPAYMSPEQIESARDVDAASDQYSLGVILYECLTGRQAFAGDGVYAVLSKVGAGRFEAPRVSRPDIDPRLEAVVLKAMAHQRAERFASLAEFGTALLPFASARSRMIWGTTFQPRAEHGPADTRLDLVRASSQADTLHEAVHERDTTTIPMGSTRRGGRAAVWVVVAVVVVVAVLGAGWRMLQRGEAPARATRAAPVAVERAMPTPLVVATPTVEQPTVVAVPIAGDPPAPTLVPSIASTRVVRSPAPSHPTHHPGRRQPRVPDLPP